MVGFAELFMALMFAFIGLQTMASLAIVFIVWRRGCEVNVYLVNRPRHEADRHEGDEWKRLEE